MFFTTKKSICRCSFCLCRTIKWIEQWNFFVEGRWLFEVGGKSKDFSQIKDEPNSFLALDGMELGHGNRIPLWMFGLLY